MRRSFPFLPLLAALASAAAAPAPAAADLSRETFERVAPAVAQVRARDCRDGPARSGTGFLFEGGDRLVTALHVVAGCSRLDVYFERGGGRTLGAELDRALVPVDLALLRLDGDAGAPLAAAPGGPQANDELVALAFFLGAPSLDNKSLKVTFGATRLAGMLPAEVRKELDASRAIDLELEIVRLDGHLLPGASGAPLLDGEGRVAAIGSGGLQSGAASISWGLPATHLAGLLSAPAGTGDAGAGADPVQSASLYATPEPETERGAAGGAAATDTSGRLTERLTCGEMVFLHLGSRGFRELAAAADDPLGLEQLLERFALYGISRAVVEDFRFEVYVPEEQGAAAAVPDWMGRPVEEDVCRAYGEGSAADSTVEVSFGGMRLEDAWQLQEASELAEFVLLRHANWWPDPSFSYLAPSQRPDGLVVRRKTFHGPSPLPERSALAFETLAARDLELFGIVAIDHAYDGAGADRCAIMPGGPGCAEVATALERLAHGVLAAHLSTFPIY